MNKNFKNLMNHKSRIESLDKLFDKWDPNCNKSWQLNSYQWDGKIFLFFFKLWHYVFSSCWSREVLLLTPSLDSLNVDGWVNASCSSLLESAISMPGTFFESKDFQISEKKSWDSFSRKKKIGLQWNFLKVHCILVFWQDALEGCWELAARSSSSRYGSSWAYRSK